MHTNITSKQTASTSKSARIGPGFEPIEGYVLEERLGQGGFGEVWRAIAPGGLKKAVKFVYGKHGERHAAQELKSLERIRGIQHPFILTLERFEFIDGQLVVVTELAEGSLEELYLQHRKRGSCGIPRDALLGYLHDAADALDYLHQHYKLQHLDIKPGNLLLVGGRVKVADFGLLKDLGEMDCSIVGGLTPIYAPPEVFDGRPSLHSDQYSLAVMYQELLTGTRPFSGRTIAQLATQHVHSAPNLAPLPASDRPTVARALEKTPERRFDSCVAFVEKLANPHGSATGVVSEDRSEPAPRREIEDLPQVEDVLQRSESVHSTHALVVALGGTGGDVLNQIRGRIFAQGASSPLTLHSVLIDTELAKTQTVMMIDPTEQVHRTHVLAARLKSPQQYRTTGTERLASLSRRWIYNVPRNGQTGGMRPLGRLALLDHSQELVRVLSDAVKELKDSTGGGEPAKVYIAASLTGGTGSGMYFDVAYLLRHTLDEFALEDTAIVSLLTTTRFQGDPAKPIALHSTKSAFNELRFFLQPGNSYPGDAGVGWPMVPAARTPLHDAYLIAPKDRATESRTVDMAAEYLWMDATLENDALEKGRQLRTPSDKMTSVRTVGAIRIGQAADQQSVQLIRHNTKSLLLAWLGNPKFSQPSASEFCKRIIRRCYLDVDALRVITEQWLVADGPRQVGSNHETQPTESDYSNVIAEQSLQQLHREIRNHLQDRRLDLSSTLLAIHGLLKHCGNLRHQLSESMGQDWPSQTAGNDSESEHRDELRHREKAEISESVAQIGDQAMAGIEQALRTLIEVFSDASARVAQAIKLVDNELGSDRNPWQDLSATVVAKRDRLLSQLHERCATSHLFRLIDAPHSVQIESWLLELGEESGDVSRLYLGDSIAETSGDRLSATPNRENQTTRSMVSAVEDSVADSGSVGETNRLSGLSDTQAWNAGQVPTVLTIEEAVEAVRPALLECGGKQRLYLICRSQAELDRYRAQLPDGIRSAICGIVSAVDAPVLIHEGQQIDLRCVLGWLDSLTGDDGKISQRLATRCDIDW
ncbi:protein kinase domain-containing protein [Rhodopirellula sp. MGV]|uniref:protein kinase domain-containing protein n=1 Tax=Rhodopirellula sp. MGV TaxID=2023130 RepID=UPI000B967531|nr:tubulin-like doman-containing protein [Rhodopirellula sp. MGV]OYP32947.1 hypothetical protein CGZ80_18770 [Rhodopirellula sp. MGV]PNY35396.1 protein kinase [Rhodopirellula baltica]